MLNESLIIIHYSEIGLKKGNRAFFERQLKKNIKRALKDLSGCDVKPDFGRFRLFFPATAPVDKIVERLQDVMGIAYFSVAHNGSTNVHELKNQVFEKLEQVPFTTFRIDTKRTDKNFPLTSVQVNQIVGARIHTDLKKPVDLMNPDLTCFIEIYNQKVFFYFKRTGGQRGLPIGSSGKVVSLLSAGIDSPVASYRMMTRGCKVAFVHFHSFPFTEKKSYYNAISLVKLLTRFQYDSFLYLVPLAKIQQAIIMYTPPKLRLILYRRAMLRIAEKIAINENARALVTGESVGQVASQTLENLAATSEAVSMPILRPLIGMDKDAIIAQARKLGTFSISTEPYDDCCSYLVPPQPETKAKIYQVHEAESQVEDYDKLLQEIMAAIEIKRLKFLEIESPK